jgi:hypothetical protein
MKSFVEEHILFLVDLTLSKYLELKQINKFHLLIEHVIMKTTRPCLSVSFSMLVIDVSNKYPIISSKWEYLESIYLILVLHLFYHLLLNMIHTNSKTNLTNRSTSRPVAELPATAENRIFSFSKMCKARSPLFFFSWLVGCFAPAGGWPKVTPRSPFLKERSAH